MKNSFVLPTIYALGFFEFASQSMLLPVMPLYTTKLGASVSQIGAIVALLAYGTALFMILFGLLSDRFGRRTFLIIGLTISALACLLYTITTDVAQLSLVRAFHGMGLAAQIPVTISAVLDLSPENQRGKALGWYTTATQSGNMIGPVIGGFFFNHFGYTVVFFGGSILSLAGLAIIFLRFKIIPQRKIARLSINKSWGWLKQKALYGALLTPFAIAVGMGTLNAYIPIYCDGFGINAVGAGLIITAAYASSAMLRAAAGTMSDKIGRKSIILFGLALSAAAIALISNLNSLLLLSITAFCFGIGFGIGQPSSMALTADLSPGAAKGLAIGIYTTFFQLGYAIGPTAMGAVAGIINLETMFFTCGVILACALIVIYILFRTGRSSLSPT